jgi:phosphoribosylformimino-5-aminoimidazole carboxamide ribotide isomerase
LETLAGPKVLQALGAEHGSDSVVFSLDLKAGQVFGNTEAWTNHEPVAIARQTVEMGIRRLLVLDLAHVGSGAGTGTEELCRQLAAAHSKAQLAAGGGVASMADVQRLEASGVGTVLVASALHDGRISTIH